MKKARDISRRNFVGTGLAAGLLGLPTIAAANGPRADANANQRAQWIGHLKAVSEPVLAAIAARRLHAEMPVEAMPGHEADRRACSYLEAFARLLAGLAPWLELEATGDGDAAETALRKRYLEMAQQGIEAAVDPGSPDYMNFGAVSQTLVDSSFLSLALLRAPRQLLASMSAKTRENLIRALQRERPIQPPFSNWLLFAALNELLLRKLDAPWDRMRVDYAIRELDRWYLGDGTYGDGPVFHADFYNSYVIHPYLLAIADEVGDDPAWTRLLSHVRARAQRYAAIQERMIGPAGEFQVLGRSITYRCGAFHLLSDVSLRKQLPAGVAPAAVRCALTAVQARTLWAPGTFDPRGWLQIGLAGHQPSLGEPYISTGSLYLCSAVWLPLGLPASDPFWASQAADWTQKRVWAGADMHADHALDG